MGKGGIDGCQAVPRVGSPEPSGPRGREAQGKKESPKVGVG